MHLENSFCVAYTVKANFLEACENKGSAVEWEVELNSHPQEWDFTHSLQVENIYMLLLMSKGSLLERLFFISPI